MAAVVVSGEKGVLQCTACPHESHVSGYLVEVSSRLGLHAAAHATINITASVRNQPDAARCRQEQPVEWWMLLRGSEPGGAISASAHPPADHAALQLPYIGRSQLDSICAPSRLFETADFAVLALFSLSCTPYPGPTTATPTSPQLHHPRRRIGVGSTALQSTRGTAPSGFAKPSSTGPRHAPPAHLLGPNHGTSQPEQRAEDRRLKTGGRTLEARSHEPNAQERERRGIFFVARHTAVT
jgi:hypothetical protein